MSMSKLEALLQACPHAPDFTWKWSGLMNTPVGALMSRMDGIQQNPVWHGEGDVGRHTRLVCEALAADPAFRLLPVRSRQELAVAALLHDIGKIPNTKLEDGQWIAPNHSSTGARMARELLWKEFGLCGTEERQAFRETVCLLIRNHMLPMHILDQTDPEKRLLQAAADRKLCHDFSIEQLCILARADARGRIAPDIEELLEKVALCRQEAESVGCLHDVGAFADAYTQRAYFRGQRVWREQSLYDNTWGEVILLSGLPGTGKDTWISQCCAHLPSVSLDELRRTMGISPADEQGSVAQAAREQARKHLRARQSFVWNATNLTEPMRSKLVSLFEDYGAAVRIVYLETSWEENLRRNADRADAVPEHAVEDMLGKLVPPQQWEAKDVDWVCV